MRSSSTLRISQALISHWWLPFEPLVDSPTCRDGGPYILRTTRGAPRRAGPEPESRAGSAKASTTTSIRAGYDKHVPGPERLPASTKSCSNIHTNAYHYTTPIQTTYTIKNSTYCLNNHKVILRQCMLLYIYIKNLEVFYEISTY